MGRQGLGPASGRSDASQRFSVAQQSIDPIAANPPGMNSVLVVHLVLGILVALCAALFVWRTKGRRITLYVLTLQIFIGIWLLTAQMKAPSVHYALAFVGWIGYMAANGMSRKAGQERNVLVITGASTAMVLAAFVIGLHAVGKI